MAQSTIDASVTPMIPTGSASPLQLSSPNIIRSSAGRLGTTLASQMATDLDNVRVQINRLNSQAQIGPQITEILLKNQQGQVTAAFGDVTYQGVVYVNYLSEIHVGNPLNTRDPKMALFNANLDGSVSIGQHGWLDVHDPFDGNAAWIGTQYDTLAVTGAYNNGAGLIRLTVPGHDFVTGNTAEVRNLQFYGVPNGIGTWPLNVIDGKTIDLVGSVWAGAFTAPANPPAGIDTFSPTINRVLQIIGAFNAAGLIEIQTGIPHTYETGDRVNIPVLPGVDAAVGQWTLTVVNPTHFTLNDSVFSGAFFTPGTCLRYFAGILAQTIAIGASFEDYKLREFADGSLRIKNAAIDLSSANGTIILDPVVPSIDLASPNGEIVLNGATSQIVLTTTANAAKIIIDAAVPSIKLFNSAGTLSVTIDSNGTVTAGTFTPTGPSFTGTATFRNAAGTGTSSLTFVNGFCTAYTP